MQLSFSNIGWLALVTALVNISAYAVSVPACQFGAAPTEKNLTEVVTSSVSVPGLPFGVVYATRQKNIAFVTSNLTLAVLNTSALTPTLKHQIPLPYFGAGLTITNDGRHLVLAAGYGVTIVDTELAIAGLDSAVVGFINGSTPTSFPGRAAIEVSVTKDDQYAFVSQEYGSLETGAGPLHGNIDVLKINRPLHNGTVTGSRVGYLSLGLLVVGQTLSPDGKTLYATAENYTTGAYHGAVNVIDVEKLEKNSSEALIANVTSGCGTVRTLLSSDGKTLWITARASNRLLAYDTKALAASPSTALVASVQVGTAPVGLTFARNETRIVVASSNRFEVNNASAGLSVVDVEAALAGKQADFGSIPTGGFPREMTTSPDGRVVLVANFDSADVQVIDVTTLP